MTSKKKEKKLETLLFRAEILPKTVIDAPQKRGKCYFKYGSWGLNMKRPIEKKKKPQKLTPESTMDTLYRSVAKQVGQFYRRWSKAARKHSAQD